MKKIMTVFLILGLMFVPALAVHAAVETGAPAPAFTLTDSNGKTHNLSDFKGKYVVLEWVNYDCPFVKKHYQSGNMQKLQEDTLGKDVVWLSINSSNVGNQGYYEPEAVNEIIANTKANPSAYLLDTDGSVGKMYGAKTTPHMYVVNPEGVLIYQGAIDDHPSFDPNDIPKSKNYVMMALKSAMAGTPVGESSTIPYGCSVKY